MAELSIIIPHHNCSTMLERMLKSIPQTEFYQTIVVDDHSTNEEYNAVEKLQTQYSIELYHNDGQCAGGARNTGLKHVESEWVLFLDADDFVVPEFDQLIKDNINTDADIVFFNVSSCYSDTKEPAYRHEHVASLFTKYNANGDENLFRCCYLSPVAKLFRMDLIKQHYIRFDEIPAGNDMWFSANTGVLAKKIKIVDCVLYMITVSAGSITTTLSKDRFESRLQATLRTNKFLRAHGKSSYQISVLYFLGKANQFGCGYLGHVIWSCIKKGANPFIGAHKLLHIKKVLEDRQNSRFTIKK